MARLKDDAQWIVLMGFVVSFALFFIAILINQSTVVGQTTAEAVSEFPKTDIRNVRGMIIQSEFLDGTDKTTVQREIRNLSLSRHNAVVNFSAEHPGGSDPYTYIKIHYNNGVTAYNETWRSE
ncbi:MAG TPA: hypothetical protein VHN82_01935 [Methanoregula sp.]|nr:hypothetical protein [Methanoregula sp.]